MMLLFGLGRKWHLTCSQDDEKYCDKLRIFTYLTLSLAKNQAHKNNQNFMLPQEKEKE